jgi:hypothetical protein
MRRGSVILSGGISMGISSNEEAVARAEEWLRAQNHPCGKLQRVFRGIEHDEYYGVCFQHPDNNISPCFILITVPVNGDEPFYGVIT